MPAAEATARWEDLHSHVVAQSAQAFATGFLQRCLRTNIEHLRGDAQQIAQLDVARLLSGYRHSDRRLILIDFEGTLWTERDPRAKVFEPPKEALEMVQRIAKDRRNEVWLLSGFKVKGMLDKVAEAIPGIGIV